MRHKAVIVLLALIIVIAAGTAWRAQSKSVMSQAPGYLADKLTTTLGSSVTVGGLELTGLNSVALTDIAITDRQGQLLAVSPKIIVTYNPLQLLKEQAVISAIREISVSKPQLFVHQRGDGQWNISELFERQQAAPTFDFTGQVRLIDGSVTIGKPEGQWQLDQVNGALDFAAWPAISLGLTAHNGAAALELSGMVTRNGTGTITVAADQLQIADYAALVPSNLGVQLTGGAVTDLTVTLTRNASGTVNYAGEVRLAGAGVVSNDLPLTDANGLVTFTDKQVTLLATTAQVAGQTVRASGTIATDTTQPVFDLQLAAGDVDITALPLELPLAVSGHLGFTAALQGTAANPIINGQFTLKDGKIDNIAVTAASADLAYSQQILTVKQLQAAVADGQITASGTIAINNEAYQLDVNGQGLDTTAFARWLPQLNGRSDFTVVLSGQGDPANATIAGVVTMPSGTFDDIPFTGMGASFYQQNRQLTVDYLTVGIGQGVVTASGQVNDGQLQLQVGGQQVPLAMLAAPANGMIAGTAQFNGAVTGTLANPAAVVQFSAVNGQALQQPFAEASGQLELAGDSVTLTNVVLQDGVSRHHVQGTVGLNPAAPVNLKITSRQTRAENLVKLIAPGEPLTGNVDNDLVVTGTLADLTATGQVTITDGSYRGQLIARAAGGYHYQQGELSITNFVVNSLNAQAQLHGTMSADRELNFDITAAGIDVARLHLRYPYPVKGIVNLAGKLTGTPEQPHFAGQLAASAVTLNNQQVQDVQAAVNITGSDFNIPAFGFKLGSGQYSFQGGMNISAGTIYGSLDVANGEMAQLLPLLNVTGAGVEGRLNGRLQLSGTLTQPGIWLTGTLTGGRIKNYPLDTVDVDAVLDHNIVTVNKFNAKQGQGVVAVRGSADLNGPLNFEVGARGVDAGLLTAWFDTDIPTVGQLNLAAQVTGTAASPHAAASLDIQGGAIANTSFDALYGLVILDKGSIHVNQLLLTKGPYRASAYGVVPLAALSSKGRAQATIADQMNLKVRLDEANLSILPLLTKEVAWAAGPTKGEVTITGTLAEPLITGSLVVQDGAVKFSSLGNPIQKVGVDIQFEGDRIKIKSFSGEMGGGAYSLSGSADLEGQSLTNYNLVLALNKLGIKHEYFNGPLSGILTLTDTGRRPLLSGQLTFENDTIDIPFVPEMAPSDLNLAFNVDLFVNNKVRFYNPYMYDIWASGKVKLAGSTRRPDPSGRIDVLHGTVSYLRTPFKIETGSVEFTQWRTFEPVIHLAAQTKLQRTTINLNINGPASAMDLKVTSQPAMSQQEIFSLLTLRSSYKQNAGGSGQDSGGLGRDELLGLLDVGLQMRFISEVEAAFRDAFGLDEFRLVRDTITSAPGDKAEDKESLSDREGYNLEIGKYLTDRLMLGYSMGLGHNEHSMNVRYDVTKRLSLTGEIDEKNHRRIGIETRFSF